MWRYTQRTYEVGMHYSRAFVVVAQCDVLVVMPGGADIGVETLQRDRIVALHRNGHALTIRPGLAMSRVSQPTFADS